MEKKLYLSLIFIVITTSLSAQNLFGQNKETLKIGINYIENNYYPFISIEGESNLVNNFYLWGKLNVRRHIIYDKWSKQDYFKKPFYGPSEHVALMYNFYKKNNIFASIMLGAGGNLEKMTIGPLIGVKMYSEKFYLKLYGIYSPFCKYKDSYSEEEKQLVKDKETIVYIRGFDPNSYINLEAAYKVSNRVYMGVLLERFYVNGFFFDFRILTFKERHFNNLDLRLISGINSYTTKPCFGAEIIFNY